MPLRWIRNRRWDDAALTMDGGEDPDPRALESGEKVSDQLKA